MTASTGVSSVLVSAWSTVTDPATPTLLIPTRTDVASDQEDAEGLPSIAQQDTEGVEIMIGVSVKRNMKSSRVIEVGYHHQALQRTVLRAHSLCMLMD